MDDATLNERFDRLEKRLDGLAQVTGLIDKLATLCAREFAAISNRFAEVAEHFARVDKRLNDIEDKIEAFAHRVDYEAEERHQLAERVSKIERPH